MPGDATARAALAEQRLADLKTLLDDMRGQRDDMKGERDHWREQAQRLALPASKPIEKPTTLWRWLRTTG